MHKAIDRQGLLKGKPTTGVAGLAAAELIFLPLVSRLACWNYYRANRSYLSMVQNLVPFGTLWNLDYFVGDFRPIKFFINRLLFFVASSAFKVLYETTFFYMIVQLYMTFGSLSYSIATCPPIFILLSSAGCTACLHGCKPGQARESLYGGHDAVWSAPPVLIQFFSVLNSAKSGGDVAEGKWHRSRWNLLVPQYFARFPNGRVFNGFHFIWTRGWIWRLNCKILFAADICMWFLPRYFAELRIW